MKKMKYVFAATLLSLTAQWSAAGELEDAVGFVNSMLTKCKSNIGQTKDSSGITSYHLFFNDYRIENGVVSDKSIRERKGSYYFKNVVWSWANLKDLDANFELSKYDGKGVLEDRFEIKLTCHSGVECVDYRSRFDGKEFSDDISNQPLKKSQRTDLTFCSQSDRDRAAVALKDAIRLSGGKTSKY